MYDDDIEDPDKTMSWGAVAFKKSKDPSNAWTIPIVTGHKYKIKWQQDIEAMTITTSSGGWR